MTAATGKGRGRPRGSKNRLTVERVAAMEEIAEQISSIIPNAFEGDGVALLQAVYKDPKHDIQLRVDAANKAAAFERAKLMAVQQTATVEQTVTVKQDAADEVIRRLARLRDRSDTAETDRRH